MSPVTLLICIFAFAFTYICGSRGFFAFDQSIVFDGGYRIYQGQIPYIDFVFSHGIFVFALQALLFTLLGVNYGAMIFGAAIGNALAALFSIALVQALFPKHKLYSYLAGIITSLWFFPPFGTLFPEQLGFLLGLCGLYLTVESVRREPALCKGAVFTFLAGCCAAVSLLCKQNTGIFLLPLYFILVLWFKPTRKAAYLRDGAGILLGFAAVSCVFALWILYAGASGALIKHSFTLPFAKVAARVSVIIWPLTFAGLLILASALLGASRSEKIKNWQLPGAAAIICLYLMALSFGFDQSMYNNPSLSYVFVGLVFGLALGVVHEALVRELGCGLGWGGNGLAFTGFVLLTGFGAYISLYRIPQESVAKASFGEYLQSEGLSWLRWGKPTHPSIIDKVDLPQHEFLELVEYLRDRKEKFFIFPDFTILYGLAGVPSPQPILWFHRGLTYPEDYDRELDLRIVFELARDEVKLVVLEKYSFFGTEERLSHFPLLKAFIERNFAAERKFNFFTVLTRQAPDFSSESATSGS